MSAPTRRPPREILSDSEHQSSSNDNNATSTPSTQGQSRPDTQQTPSSGAVQVGASSSRSKGEMSAPIKIGKRKDRDADADADADATPLEPQTSKQNGSSLSTKRVRTAASDVRASDGSDVLSSETPTHPEVSVQQNDVPRSIGKRKERDEDELPSGENSSASQATSVSTSSNQTPIISVSPEREEDRPPKKQRLETEDPVHEEADPLIAEPDAEPKASSLLTLPLELLADILIRTRSPQHVLATARSCKALFHTLISPDAAFIWREARKGCSYTYSTQGVTKTFTLPELPEQFFSEPAYAAFVFDSGPCDNCHKETAMMYHSFALRLRLCKSRKCKWSSKIAAPHYIEAKVRAILPMNEATPQALSNGSILDPFWPDTMGLPFYRTEDRQLAGYRPQDEEFEMKFEMRAKRKIEWMMLCVNLIKWKFAREHSYSRIAIHNKNRSEQIAQENGWDYEILKTTVYGSYLSNKTRLIEEVNDVDLEVMRDEIEAKLISVGEKRGRRADEIALMNNRKEVEKTYNRLRSSKDYPYMPSLRTFRTLPVVAMLQSSASSDLGSIYETLKNDKRMKDLLSNQMKAWIDKAKIDLGALLGCPKNWKNASSKVLHPAERVTARYMCTQCERFDEKYRMHESFDFAGACLHECGQGSGKKAPKILKGKKADWKRENFVKDEKAVKALKAIVEAFNLNNEDLHDSGYKLLNLQLGIVCNSCSPSMVLDSGTIIGHSHRHEDMQLSFNTSRKDIVTMMGGYPYEEGLVQKLLAHSSFTGVAEIARKNFGCRHCLRTKQIEDPVAAADAVAGAMGIEEDSETSVGSQEPEDPARVTRVTLSRSIHRLPDLGRSIQGPALPPPPLFNFNGIRSHVKAKHGIKDIRDEDILCYRPPDI